VCTVRIGDRDVIVVCDIITADPDRGRDDLAAYLTDLFVDLTGDAGRPALRPARQPAHLNRGHLMATGAPGVLIRTGPGAARTHRPGAVLAATEGGEGVSVSCPLGSQYCGRSSLRTPGPLRSPWSPPPTGVASTLPQRR